MQIDYIDGDAGLKGIPESNFEFKMQYQCVDFVCVRVCVCVCVWRRLQNIPQQFSTAADCRTI
jgi:hypothetical protein